VKTPRSVKPLDEIQQTYVDFGHLLNHMVCVQAEIIRYPKLECEYTGPCPSVKHASMYLSYTAARGEKDKHVTSELDVRLRVKRIRNVKER